MTNEKGSLLEARENASDQVGNGLSFAFDELRWWFEFSGPITEQRKAKPKEPEITSDTHLLKCGKMWVTKWRGFNFAFK